MTVDDWPAPVTLPDRPIEEDPGQVPELVAVLDALRRGARRTRLRLLDVACPKDHRVVEVFATAAGPIAVAKTRDVGLTTPSPDGPVGFYSRGTPVAVRLSGADPAYILRVQCRCAQRDVPVGWIVEQIRSRRRRVVWAPPE